MKPVALETGEPSRVPPQTHKGNKGISILDLVLRAVAIVATLASAVAMGTTNETLPIFNQFIQVKAQYNDLPTFTFFVIVNSVVCFYLVVSLPMSVFHIVRSGARISRVILIFLDSVMLALLTVGAAAAAAIVYLAHKGNASANWLAICQQFNSFCERVSESLIGSFGAILGFIVLILLSAIALCRRP
ncbi:hypothetical protein RHGRI_033700 [Rhododendron griersonianum]|uniref:CASP-like protein n=1 Tax=Rhododendron griersonianum TaxID=479676 RepID=A0AAV6I0B5_9ERIC|nr:hypothetical protein RHGRI_033700 [Rhododendron griersonianum]